MTNKPRYRYDWKMGWWVIIGVTISDRDMEFVSSRISTDPVIDRLVDGGRFTESVREPGRYMSDAESSELASLVMSKNVLQ